MTLVQPLTLLASSNAKWTTTQEKTIARDYPFTDIHLETPDQFVVRTYLQFLWLPESIMPIDLLVPSLHRVQDASPGPLDTPHPLHALLEPLLLSVRSAVEKYHTELPQILSQDGGEGGAEESMMWYALEYENNEIEEVNTNAGGEDAVMLEEKSRNMWFERLERREIQIQILLYLIKLSLPGPCTPLPPVTISANDRVFASKKRSKKRVKVVTPTAQERLESFMDKLSIWQLVINVNNSSKRLNKDEHDWMRVFFENVVERQFKSTLPDMCALLRRKLFPHSPFEDDSVDESGARSSPVSQVADPVPSRPKPTRQLTRSSTLASVSESKDNLDPKPLRCSSSNIPDARSRSRSLSVSLAQDASARRSNTVSGPSSLKRALSREVSMSRGFKPRVQRSGTSARKVPAKTREAKKEDRHSRGVTLVAATPTKPKVRGDSGNHRQVTGQSRSRAISPDLEGEGGMSDDLNGSDGKEEGGELWLADSSPDVLLGARKRTASGSSSTMGYPDPTEEGMDTPVKKRLRM